MNIVFKCLGNPSRNKEFMVILLIENATMLHPVDTYASVSVCVLAVHDTLSALSTQWSLILRKIEDSLRLINNKIEKSF